MTHRPQLSDALFEAAEEVRQERGLPNIDTALRYMVREGGYDI